MLSLSNSVIRGTCLTVMFLIFISLPMHVSASLDGICSDEMSESQCRIQVNRLCALEPNPQVCIDGYEDQVNERYGRTIVAPFEGGDESRRVSGVGDTADPNFIISALDINLVNPLRVNGTNINTIEGLITLLLDTLVIIMTPVIIFMIVYAGFKYVTAQGNPGDIESASKTLTYALIGAVLVLGAVTLSEIIQSTIGSFTR